jgi:hypothetical protein
MPFKTSSGTLKIVRSTLLFVAVLLACTPVHAQATAPIEAPILNAWLAAILPVPSAEAARKTTVKQRTVAPSTSSAGEIKTHSPIPEALLPIYSATLLTHDSNAP